MPHDDARLRCVSCGAVMAVAAESAFIAEEAFWHRRHFHQELARLDFIATLPFDESGGAITIAAGKLVADQWRRLAEWDARIAHLTAAA